MKADELWEKYSGNGYSVSKSDFLAAIEEYGQAVRDRDAEICEFALSVDRHAGPNDCAAAISREPLP